MEDHVICFLCGLEPLHIVSSPFNILNRSSETLHMSFTYIVKSNGPNIDLCGPPRVMFNVLDF